MHLDHAAAQAHLKAAGRETLLRVQQDYQRAPLKIKPLLAYLEAHLFDPDLNVNHLKRACGVRDNSMPMQFRKALGDSPRNYIAGCRFEIATKLLRDSDIPVWQIADLLGFSSLQAFSRAFAEWSGQRPTRFRKLHAAQASPVELSRTDTLRKALLGSLETHEAQNLMQCLHDIYSTQGSEQEIAPLSKVTLTTTDEDLRQAEDFWQRIEDLAPEEQRSSVRAAKISSPALFHLLHRKSREIGRDNRPRSLEIAELALESLYAGELEILLGNRLDVLDLLNLKARAWAWLGQARRLALDFDGAEKAFSTAEAYLPTERQDRRVRAEILQYRAGLRWYQRRFDEAIDLQERAVSLFRLVGESHPLAESLILRSLIQRYAGRSEAGLAGLQEALQLIDSSSQPFLLLSAYYNLAVAHARAGQFEQAAELLPKTKALCAHLSSRRTHHHIQSLEALVLQGQEQTKAAEEKLLAAREGFLEGGEVGFAAAVSLELALLYSHQPDRFSEVTSLTLEAISVFESLNIHQEALVALRLLRENLDKQQASRAALKEIKEFLDEVRRDPTAPLSWANNLSI